MIRMTRFSRLATATGGASSIEFALVATFLLVPLTLGLYDFGTALWNWMQVGNAARAGAQYINVNGYSSTYTTTGNICVPAGPLSTSFTCAVQGATGLGDNVSVSVGNSYCGCQNGTTYTAQAYAPPCNVCGSFVAANCCPAGQTAVTMTQVTATYNYKPIFNYLGFGPTSGFNLSAQATALLY